MSDSEFGSDGQIIPVFKTSPGEAAALEAAYAQPLESVDPFAASEPASAAQRLRDFEDKHLGADTPRHLGKVERGHGAPLRNLSDELRREHAALEARSESEKGSG